MQSVYFLVLIVAKCIVNDDEGQYLIDEILY